MTALSYEALLHRLFPRLTGGVRWGLERTERLLAAVGDPHLAFPVLHVGGTNGKGSVAAMLEAVLRAHGLRTGLYTSPHLCTFRERIRIGGRPVTEADIVAAAERLWPSLEEEDPSFFEGTTALAFLVFARASVQAAVVEVGLGGRLDATNVVAPRVVIITNVAMDHAEHLGATPAAVAREKAGILKPGVPAFTATADEDALAVLGARAAEVGAPLTRVGSADVRDVRTGPSGTRFGMRTGWGELELATPLVGAHQATNAALAVRALEALAPDLRPGAEAVRAGLAATRLPGRLQVAERGGVPWVFDVAHNPDAAAALARALDALALPRPRLGVVGILRDKDWAAMLALLEGVLDRLLLVAPPEAPAERRWDPAAAARAVRRPPAEVPASLDAALERAGAPGLAGSVVVTGSFYTVGGALARLGLAPDGLDPPLPMAAGSPLQVPAGGE